MDPFFYNLSLCSYLHGKQLPWCRLVEGILKQIPYHWIQNTSGDRETEIKYSKNQTHIEKWLTKDAFRSITEAFLFYMLNLNLHLSAPQKVPRGANWGFRIPNNTASFIVGDHGPPPQVQLLPIQTLQASVGKRRETQSCCRPEIGPGILTAMEYFQTSLTKKYCMVRKPPTSPNSLCHPILCSKDKLKSCRKQRQFRHCKSHFVQSWQQNYH